MERSRVAFGVIAYSRRFSFPNNNPFIPPHYPPWTDVDDLAALIRILDLHDARIIGQSTGTFVAQAFKLKHANIVHSLVLSEPPAHQLIRDTSDGEIAYQKFVLMVMTQAADSFRKHDVQHATEIIRKRHGSHKSIRQPFGLSTRASGDLLMARSFFPGVTGLGVTQRPRGVDIAEVTM